MEPNYDNLDPEERINKQFAVISVLFGSASVCAGIIPIAGIISGLIGLIAGIRGRKSDSKSLAILGVIISAFGMTISFVYAIFVYIAKY